MDSFEPLWLTAFTPGSGLHHPQWCLKEIGPLVSLSARAFAQAVHQLMRKQQPKPPNLENLGD